MARRPASRPWLPLGLLSAVIVVAYACILGFGLSPRLGLDLSGGTSLTLQPTSCEKGKKPTSAQLDKAVDIIRKRVDSFGVGESSVARQGPYIVVEVPGSDRNGVVNKVGSTALLYFREVATYDVSGASALAAEQSAEASAAAAASAAATASPAATSGSAAASSTSATIVSAAPSAAATSAATASTASPAAATSHGRPLPQLAAAASTSPSASPAADATSPSPAADATSPSPDASAAPSASASSPATVATGANPCAAVNATAAVATPSATPSADASAASPNAVASPSAAVSSAASAAAVTSHGRPLPVLAAAATTSPSPVDSPSLSPAAGVTPTPAAASGSTAAVSATPTAAASASPVPKDAEGVPLACAPLTGTLPADAGMAHAKGCYAVLDCTDLAERNAGAGDAADAWSVGCGGEGSFKNVRYLLKPAKVKGTDISDANANIHQTGSGQAVITTNEWEVDISFKNSKFEKLTETTAYGTSSPSQPTCSAAQPTVCQVAIVLDGVVESSPVNQDSIPGQAQITGSFTENDAETLANVLKFGALPLSFADNPTSDSISPTLGKSSLHAGLLAGGLGLLIVVVYCFIYYRALGIVTIASLGVSGVMVYGAIVLLGKAAGLTLSLAGIAGFIVAIGITADSFVVFYERLKDEIRDGRSARSAVEVGWRSARRTIISADFVSILAAVLLYIVSIGSVRGFAFTLGVSTTLDLVTVFFFTKPLVTLLIAKPFFSTGRYSGLSASTPQAPIRRRPGPGGRLNPDSGLEA